MLNEHEDLLFGERVVSLNLISAKHLQDCVNLQKQWFFEGEHMSLPQCLVRFHYLTPQQVEIVQKEIKEKAPKHKVLKNFGRYQIILEIGRGSMGVVNKAYDPQLKRVIAIKILQNKGHDDVERFTREAKATAKLKHPNIVEVYDIGCFDRKYFYAMDYIEGLSLEELMQKKKLTIRNSLRIVKQVCEGIAYAHENGVIHRDLKPANIMIDKSGQPKVMDFGLAKIMDEHDQLSKSGMIIGTLQYMSPEQAEGKLHLVGKHSDVYSLGAILYEMLTGRVTFAGNSFAQVVDQILYKIPVPPTHIKKIIPIELENICLKALEKKPEHRYTDVSALLLDLSNFIQGKSIAAPKAQLGMRETFLQAKFYKKRIFTAIFILIFIISSCFLMPNYKIRSNHKKVAAYAKKMLANLDAHTDFLYTNTEIPYVFDKANKQKLHNSLKKYIELDTLLYKRIHFESATEDIQKLLRQIKREIILQSYLNDNELMAILHLQNYKIVSDENTYALFQKNIEQSQQHIKAKFINRIKQVMNSLSQYEDYMHLYANEFSQMPTFYSLEVLISYLDSDLLLQRILAIRTLGLIHKTGVSGQNRTDRLIEKMQKITENILHIESIENQVEIHEIIVSLMYIAEPKAIEAVHKCLGKIQSFGILWYKASNEYHNSLHLSESNLDSNKEDLLIKRMKYYLENNRGKKNCIVQEWKDSDILNRLKRVDAVLETENDVLCHTFLFTENTGVKKIIGMSKPHAFLFYQEKESFDSKLVNALEKYVNESQVKTRISRIQVMLSNRNIFKRKVTYEYDQEKKEVCDFYIMPIAKQHYIIAVSKSRILR